MAVLPTPPFWLQTMMRRVTLGRSTSGAGLESSHSLTDWASPWMRETLRSAATLRNVSHCPGGRKVEKESAPAVSTGSVAEARAHQSLMPCSTAVWISMPCWAALTFRSCRSCPGSLETTLSRSPEEAGELMGVPY